MTTSDAFEYSRKRKDATAALDGKGANPEPGADFGELISIAAGGGVLYVPASESESVNKLQPGDFIGLGTRGEAYVMQLQSLDFDSGKQTQASGGSRRRGYYLGGHIIGRIKEKDGKPVFLSGSSDTPPLQLAAFGLNRAECAEVISPQTSEDSISVCLGAEVRTEQDLEVDLENFLGRHVAVLGSSGSGKSCLAAAVLQQLVELKRSRIIIFDINGEYESAFAHCPPGVVELVHLGEEETDGYDNNEQGRGYSEGPDPLDETPKGKKGVRYLKIPYYALGRAGLMRLLQPEEKAQRPALDFALAHLHYLEWSADQAGAMLVGGSEAMFFDDCRQTNANETHVAMEELRYGMKRVADQWPHMQALGALVADSFCLEMGRSGWSRSSALYEYVSPLINRIHRLVEDVRFRSVIEIGGGLEYSDRRMNLQQAGDYLVRDVFGDISGSDEDWRIKIINMRSVPHDLLPLILDALLGQLAHVLFQRGPGQTHPTMLVLEEAHHYLMQERGGRASDALLAYERLAKEGRKFGISLWLSTQRPSEVSPTVISQCGNWVVFRLISDMDINQVKTASEWIDDRTAGLISGLPQREALVFGSAIPVPMRIKGQEANPLPTSQSPDFAIRWVS